MTLFYWRVMKADTGERREVRSLEGSRAFSLRGMNAQEAEQTARNTSKSCLSAGGKVLTSMSLFLHHRWGERGVPRTEGYDESQNGNHHSAAGLRCGSANLLYGYGRQQE